MHGTIFEQHLKENMLATNVTRSRLEKQIQKFFTSNHNKQKLFKNENYINWLELSILGYKM